MTLLRLVDPPHEHDASGFSLAEIQAMQRAVINLAQRWGVTDDQLAVLLGDISVRSLHRWKQGQMGRVGIDLAARLSNIMGIHKALRLLFKDPNRGYGWIKRPNDHFDGNSALEVMLGGQLTDLMRVRRYLDTARSPW
jgi:hypothetical protein